MAMSMETINLSNTDVWKTVDNIGSTTYININDGSQQVVPWGTLDYWNIITGNILSFAILGGMIWVGIHYLMK